MRFLQPVNIIEPKPSISRGKRLEIVELQKIEKEISKIQDIHLNVNDESNLPQPKPKQPKVYSGDCADNDSEEDKQEEAASILCYRPKNAPLPKTKEEKMSLNINFKESLDIGGSGDAVTILCPENIVANNNYSDNNCDAVIVSGGENTVVNNTSSDKDDPMALDDSLLDSSMIYKDVKPQSELHSILKELFPDETLKKCHCGDGYLLRSWQFENKWQHLKKLPNAVEEQSKLIRLICPHRFPKGKFI